MTARGGASGEPSGGGKLTPAQAEIARLYAQGWRAVEIAEHLGISTRTVHQHAWDARRRGAEVPRLPRGAPNRKADYLDLVRSFRELGSVTRVAERHGVWPSTVSRALRIMREAGASIPAPAIGGSRPGAFGRRAP